MSKQREYFVRFSVGHNWRLETIVTAVDGAEAMKIGRAALAEKYPQFVDVVQACDYEEFA